MFCDKVEKFLSDEDDKIVTNGVEITKDAHQWLMSTLKDNEDFDMGENGDADSCRFGFLWILW